MSVTERFKTMEKGFGLVQALAEAERCLLCHDAPCSKGCPAETDPATFIRKLRLRNVKGAIRTIKTNNALGGACGVLCPTARLCEKECSATGIVRPIAIGKIQRFLVEHSWQIGFEPLAKKPARPEKVAVVGSGPAGLSCAAELAKEGFAVTVFEERAEPGGVIRYGVPAYRFDAAFLKHELASLERLGVQVRLQHPHRRRRGREEAPRRRLRGRVPRARALGRRAPARRREGEGRSHLRRVPGRPAREEASTDLAKEFAGKTVAVIGGGSVAMDCVESALKLGAKDAYLVYRRSFAQMPAEEDERVAALRLGVHFLLLNQPVKYLADSKGKLKGLKLVRTRLGKPDASGRRRPEPIKGSEWVLDCTVAVEAIGNTADAADWSAMVKIDDARLVVANGKTRKTSARKVFAGGDIVRGPALVVEAVQDGKLAARAIRAALSQEVTA